MRGNDLSREMERKRKKGLQRTTKERKKEKSIDHRVKRKKKFLSIQISTALFSASLGERKEDALSIRARRR